MAKDKNNDKDTCIIGGHKASNTTEYRTMFGGKINVCDTHGGKRGAGWILDGVKRNDKK
jgi:hypothetical protein